MIDTTKPLTLKQIGIELPRVPPTQVVSIRLPSTLLNQLKAYACPCPSWITNTLALLCTS